MYLKDLSFAITGFAVQNIGIGLLLKANGNGQKSSEQEIEIVRQAGILPVIFKNCVKGRIFCHDFLKNKTFIYIHMPHLLAEEEAICAI